MCVCRVRQAQSHNIADSFLQENLNLQTHAGGLAKLGSLSPLWLVLLVPRPPVRSLDFTESHAHNLVQRKMQNVLHATAHFRKTPHGEQVKPTCQPVVGSANVASEKKLAFV